MGGYKNSITDTGELITLSTSDAERLRIDSSGRVGIGESSPDRKLHITDTSAGNVTYPIRVQNGGTTTGTDVGILFTTKTSGGGSATCVIRSESEDTSGNNSLVFTTPSGGSTAERMRIDSSGNVLIGKTSTLFSDLGYYFSLAGNQVGVTSAGAALALNKLSTDGQTVQFYRNTVQVGNISVTASATAYNTSSDYRLKENVVPMEGALDRVDALKPSRFNFIADPEKTVDGFLAHEVAEVIPEAISGEKDAVDEEGNPIYQGIDQSKIVPLLVGAIQELRAEIEALKANNSLT